ncbi:MAG: hypothetical protein QOJ19_2626 [Acidimicrobiia bacterium]|jgi:hypothetical protein|nr:hypothetical protein [Acidimicrobiia bacterium]
MDTAAAVSAASPIIFQLPPAWFFAPATRAKAEELGIKSFPFYMAGRSGVLGDVGVNTAISALGFFSPTMVTKMIGDATGSHSPSELGSVFVDCCLDWGRQTFGSLEGAERAASLGRKLIDSVQPCGHALFTAWRSVPVPADGPAALALNLQTLRELRGDCHIHACGAVALTPLEAILGRDGAERAKQFGWSEPYPDAEALKAPRQQAEELTDRQMQRVYEALSADERAEFVGLLNEAKSAAGI